MEKESYAMKAWQLPGNPRSRITMALTVTVWAAFSGAHATAAARGGVPLQWELAGGLGVRASWDTAGTGIRQVRVLKEWKGKLYAGLQGSAESRIGAVWRFDGATWEKVGGGGVLDSWADGAVMGVMTLAGDETHLYAGTGAHLGQATVWRFDGRAWEKVGGDGIRGGWGADVDCVHHLAFHRGELFAGIVAEDAGVPRAPLYRWDGQRWHLVTGENHENGGWGAWMGYIMPYTLVSDGTSLFAGMAGRGENSADVYRIDSGGIVQIGGDGINGGWNHPDNAFVEDAIIRDGQLHVALNGTLTRGRRDPPVWRFDGIRWLPVGNVPAEWSDSACWIYNKLLDFRGELYLGVGGLARATGLWKLDSAGIWRKVAGNGIAGSDWASRGLYSRWIYTLHEFENRMYLGMASAETDGIGQVWTFASGTPADSHFVSSSDGDALKRYRRHEAAVRHPRAGFPGGPSRIRHRPIPARLVPSCRPQFGPRRYRGMGSPACRFGASW
jgi:hypothetical protein